MPSPRTCVVLTLLAVIVALPAEAQSIFTFAGGGTDDGRPATAVGLNRPMGMAVDAEGNLYFAEAERHRVRKVAAGTGIITTIAGSGTAAFSGDGGPASLATLDSPTGVAIDSAGNLYIADLDNVRIRRVDPSGIISTFAGSGAYDFTGDGGAATAASFRSPMEVATDEAGNVYVVDADNQRIRKISAGTNLITTVAGSGSWGFSGDGGPATMASLRLSGPVPDVTYVGARGLVVDHDGSLFVSDIYNARIRRVSPSGTITTMAGTGTESYAGDGGPATMAALNQPGGLALSPGGDLVVADNGNDRIRVVERSSERITTFAGGGVPGIPGDGGPATAAWILGPTSIAFDRNEALVIMSYRWARRVDLDTGLIQTVAGNGRRTVLDDGAPATAALLVGPQALALSPTGDLYISESGARVRRVSAQDALITTVAGTGEVGRFRDDDAPATEAYIGVPLGIGLDASDHLHIACGYTDRILKISPETGKVTVVAGNGERGFSGDGGPAREASLDLSGTESGWRSGYPSGIAFDRSGTLFFADTFNHRIRRVDGSGIITTVAGNGIAGFTGDGGPATLASMNAPTGIAFDAHDNLVIADTDNDRIRRVSGSTGLITTIAGTPTPVYPGDNVQATKAILARPSGVAFDSGSNLFIADQFDDAIRRVDALTGVITTVAGVLYFIPEGPSESFGDGGAATVAGLSHPQGVAVDPGGDLYLAEVGANRVRVVVRCTPVAPVELVSPADGSAGVSSFPSLTWNRPNAALRYDLYLDTANPPSKLVASDVATTAFSPTNLDARTTYYWRVVAKGDPFCKPPSESESAIRSFTTASACDPPAFSRQ